MYIQMQHQQGLGELGWSIDRVIGFTKTPTGHEALTGLAVRGLIKNSADLANLIDGSRRPDLADLKHHIKVGEERRHFLRSIKQSSLDAWWSAINHLRTLHQQMMASSPVDRFKLIGEALHLIQDSFAPAHVNREPRTGDILSIRVYGPGAPSGKHPFIHRFRVDPRDEILATTSPRMLTPDAQKAISCSKEYLQMALRHIQLKQFWPLFSLTPNRDLNAFISRRLWLRRPELRKGSSGIWVSEFEVWFNGSTVRINLNLPALKSHIFDSDMETAVLAFQNAIGLTEKGIVGRQTWQKLLLP